MFLDGVHLYLVASSNRLTTNMKKLLTRNPFTSYTVIGLLLMVTTERVLGIAYDEQGYLIILYWLSVLFNIVYWFVGVFISKMTSGPHAPNIYLVMAGALFVSMVLDAGVRIIWRSLARKH